MKDLYDIARHIMWLTQFGLSVCVPLVLFIGGSVWLRAQFALGGWTIFAGIVLGVLGAISGLRYSLRALERQGRDETSRTKPPVSFNRHR